MLLPFLLARRSTRRLAIIVVLLLIRGLPFAFAVVAAQTIVYGPLESEKQGPASSIYNTLRQVAASFGVALIITILLDRTSSHMRGAAAGRPPRNTRRCSGITTRSSLASAVPVAARARVLHQRPEGRRKPLACRPLRSAHQRLRTPATEASAGAVAGRD